MSSATSPAAASPPRAARAARQVELPADSRSRSTLPHLDYTDSFLIASQAIDQPTAEQWARRMLDAAPAYWRQVLPRGWRLLGLEHGPADSDDFVLGWPIAERTDDHVLLSAPGHRGLSAELLFERRPDGLLFATFVHQHNLAARLEWAAISAAHRRIVSHLLTHASRALDS